MIGRRGFLKALGFTVAGLFTGTFGASRARSAITPLSGKAWPVPESNLVEAINVYRSEFGTHLIKQPRYERVAYTRDLMDRAAASRRIHEREMMMAGHAQPCPDIDEQVLKRLIQKAWADGEEPQLLPVASWQKQVIVDAMQ